MYLLQQMEGEIGQSPQEINNNIDLPCLGSLWCAMETTGNTMACNIISLRHPIVLET